MILTLQIIFQVHTFSQAHDDLPLTLLWHNLNLWLSYIIFDKCCVQIVREKERFKTNPFNYAMKKTQLMKDRDMAVSK